MIAPRPRELWLNADFDLSLRTPPPELDAHQRAQVDELAIHDLLGGEAGETVLLPRPPPADWLEYLAAREVPVRRHLCRPAISATHELVPFGWNADAVALNRQYAAPVTHPDPAVVRQVNARRFGYQLERELAGPAAPLDVAEVTTLVELEALLERCPGEWLLKADHGNAGLGNRRLRQGRWGPAARRWAEQQLARDGALFVEPWQPRLRDLGVLGRVDPSGELVDPSCHELINLSDGAFLGTLFHPHHDFVGPWHDALAAGAEQVARALAAAGYTGPLCLDAFLYRDGQDRPALRSLVDCNARRSMAGSAARLARHWLSDRFVYWRFVNPRKFHFTDTAAAFARLLGATDFQPERRRGILLASPLAHPTDTGRRAAQKVAVLIVGESLAEVAALELDLFRRGGNPNPGSFGERATTGLPG